MSPFCSDSPTVSTPGRSKRSASDRSSGFRLSRLFSNGIVKWGIGDVYELEQWNPAAASPRAGAGVRNYRTIPLTAWRLLFGVLNATLGSPLRRAEPVRVLGRFADVDAQRVARAPGLVANQSA